MGRGRHGWGNDDLNDADRGGIGIGEDDDDEVTEDDIALRALSAWLEIEGDDDFSMAQREALAAIAEAAVAAKAEREDLEQRRRDERQQRAAAIAEVERRDTARHARAAKRRVGVATNAARLEEARRPARLRQVSSNDATREVAVGLESARQEAARARGPQQHPIDGAPARGRRPPSTSLRRTQASPPKAFRSLPRPTAGSPSPTSVPVREGSEREDIELAAVAAGLDQNPPPLKGADLTAWRAQLGLTQTSAANRLGVGQGTVSKAESRPATELGPALQQALANALGRT